jgi:Spy/CpxP family protein refolding chaperone
MKSLKILLTAIALSLVATAPAMAQQKGKQTPDQRIAQIEQVVGTLNAQQKSKIKDIIAKSSDAVQATPKEQRKEKTPAIQKKEREDISAVLTAEQRQKWQAAQKKKK